MLAQNLCLEEACCLAWLVGSRITFGNSYESRIARILNLQRVSLAPSSLPFMKAGVQMCIVCIVAACEALHDKDISSFVDEAFASSNKSLIVRASLALIPCKKT